MTSDNAKAKFAELSPEQRQLLFEKIRQKKLSNARRPVEYDHGANLNFFKASPHQNLMLEKTSGQTAQNRVLEIQLEGDIALEPLQQAIDSLATDYPLLTTALDNNQFARAQTTSTIKSVELSSPNNSEQQNQQLNDLHSELAGQSDTENCVHLTLVNCGNQQHRFLLSCHPLLLDSYSLLRLANQILSLVSGAVDREALKPKESCQQQHFATWSEQVLEKKFLRNEWNRLAPKSLLEAQQQAPITNSESFSHFFNNDFIQEFSQNQVSTKQWLCSALHQCLSSWLSYNDITYWFFDPLLKDSEFENLLGFFPYYVPLKAQSDDTQDFNISTQLSHLHTRYSAVSEHLANQLCKVGSQMPLLHYHWFDLGDVEQCEFKVSGIEHINSGQMLASIEMHITEHANGIGLNVHFDSQKLGTDQMQFLMRELIALLKQDKQLDPSKRPSLPEQLRAIWKELLQVPNIEPEQSFFELGGHSLQVTEMKFRIKQQMKVDIPISVLYELPTIEKLSSFILATHGNSLGITPSAQGDDEMEQEEGTL